MRRITDLSGEAAGVAAGGVYVHLPFCPYVCPYCDFAKWPLQRSRAQRYLRALEAEIAAAPPLQARTLFLGGGTPNTYAPATIAALVAQARERFGLPAAAEATVEMNPDPGLCTPEVFAAYAHAGITRVSLGVQSLVPEELAVLGRRHCAGDVTVAVERARRAGIGNISVDLIFAVPGQTVASWRRTLEAALALEPAHVSTYGLTIEENTPYAAWQARRPGDFIGSDAEAELYALGIDMLEAAGFEHYEISNFARPGARCAHNENYWRNGNYLGLGVGAASYLAGCRAVHTRDFETYCTALERSAAVPGDGERLEGAAQLGEAAMLALRTSEGVDVAAFKQRYGVNVLHRYAAVLTDLRAAGTLDVTPSHVRLTRRGRFIANDVCQAFVA
ncbi:MAG: radical SAM family heme chaperone HemW [Candidatus Eremiobacteraeota bacterium]|nr:radical SAM family heme chaperone HemW [Candidatus Eremiobacteraeota bacterium]MBC5803036.1 radical SAM family heme chaperone HemW [Candidatus Eremiobacteraeota bacterium]MBC5821331.1 radical SAM family heme chaperone HemW [Candidatus Eremiobacteraeota bacterium]